MMGDPVLIRAAILATAMVFLPIRAARADAVPTVPARTTTLAIEPASPGRLPWVVFDGRSGLPQHTIVDLMVDREGFVWAATQDGPARFNGRVWEPVPMPASMGTNYPRVLKLARDGGIWMGSFDGGLAHLREGAWTITDTTTGLPSNRIRGLLESTDASGASVLWIATDRGVARLQGGKATAYGEDSGLQSLDTEGLCLCPTGPGERSLLVGTTNGVARLVGDHFEPYPVPAQLLGNRIGDIVESPGPGGRPALWFTSYGSGLGVLENGDWTVLDTASGLPSNVGVLTAATADDGSPRLWIGTEGGLLRFEHGRYTRYDERNGLPVRTIWKVLETTNASGLKTVWLGTYGGGVLRLSANHWTAFDTSVGVPAGAVTSVLTTTDADDAQTVWAGTSTGELVRDAGGGFQPVPLPEPLRNAILFSLMETRDERGESSIWVASFGGGIGRYARGQWSLFDVDALPNKRVYQLLETRADDGGSVLWAATEGGLGRYEQGRWKVWRLGSGLPSDIVTQVREVRGKDGARVLWVATSRGMARFEGGSWQVLGKDSGLVSENISSFDLIDDAQGMRWLWVGTFAGGAARLRLDDPAARWEHFGATTNPALPSDTVMSIAHDPARRIYLCTTRGIARLTPRAPSAGDPAPFSADLYTVDDGLPSSDCEQGARAVDASGRIWFGTARGLARFDPADERPDHAPKPLVIERAELTDHSRTLRGGETLAHGEHNLTFSVALLAYANEARIRYRYQLAGFDPQPLEWTAVGAKEYTNLGAGDYVFRAWARDARGNESGPTELAFRIRPAPWLTPWAYALYAAALLLLAYGGVRWRTRVLGRRTLHLEQVVAERTTALRASEQRANDASQAKSVFLANMSHELRTPLNAVLGFTRLMRRSPRLDASDRDSLSIVEKSGEHLLSLINQVLSIAKIEAGSMTLDLRPFDLRELLDTVARMFQARTEEAGLSFLVEIDPDLPAAVLGDAGKLRQALINLLGNATKFTRAGSVRLVVRWRAPRAHFEVHDTGPGIAPEELGALFQPFVQTASGRGASEGTGLGLAITRRIVELMGGTIAVESSVGVGTCFRFDAVLEPAEPIEPGAPPAVATGLAPGQSMPKILVVDDARENRELLVRVLAAAGIEARTAENGAQLVELWRAWQPELIFTDVRMPVLDGREAARRIRAEEAQGGRPRVVIVALTASVFDSECEALIACGVDHVIFKPYREHDIHAVVAERLGVRFAKRGQSELSFESSEDVLARLPEDDSNDKSLWPHFRILVVDDDPINRAVARGILEDAGYDVLEADGGEAALAVLASEARIGLVLLDVEMPRMGGIETVRRIRADARHASLPVLAMSAHSDSADAERFRAAGMNDNIVKPVDPASLVATVSRWLSSRA